MHKFYEDLSVIARRTSGVAIPVSWIAGIPRNDSIEGISSEVGLRKMINRIGRIRRLKVNHR